MALLKEFMPTLQEFKAGKIDLNIYIYKETAMH